MRQTYDSTDRIRRQMPNTSEQLRKRHKERRKKQKRRIAAMRTVLTFAFFAVLICVILFMTPLFNIRKIEVSGNFVVPVEAIDECIGGFHGENLFSVSSFDIEESLSGIDYIKNISVSKNYLKTVLEIAIEERVAVGYITVSGKYLLFDNEYVMLAESIEKPETVPMIIGLSDKAGEEISELMDNEQLDALSECIGLMNNLELLDKVDSIDLSDLTNIRFRYDDRLDVTCGSGIDMDRKLRLFEASVNSNNLAPNAQGSMDLSITGNAMYSSKQSSSISKATVPKEKDEKDKDAQKTKED